MKKVVVDTNVIISGLGWRGDEREILEKIINGTLTIVLNKEILDELIDVLSRPKFKFIPVTKKAELLKYLVELADIVHPTQKFHVIKDDPSDNKFLEAAVAGNVQYIISGDSHLLKLKKFRGIRIVNAGEFLKVVSTTTRHRSHNLRLLAIDG